MREEALVTVIWDKVFESGSADDLTQAKEQLTKLIVQDFSFRNKLKIQVLKNKLGLTSQKSDFNRWDELSWKRSDVLRK